MCSMSFTTSITESTNYGTVTVKPDGSFSYTPNLNFFSFVDFDSFTYTVTSPSGATASATAHIEVEPLPPEVIVPGGVQGVVENSAGTSGLQFSGISLTEGNTAANLQVVFSVEKGGDGEVL